MARIRITFVQVMAILALLGILIGVMGTSILYSIPTAATGIGTISGEANK